ncbi:hypothetical protein Nocox_08350 [Nonomuraea coxensis DSM 45129]|uniref:Alkaline shock response membrane anchor protein AmaP n=1 Tax=Nonomuraea coxensis DSM 45129 TaxID=1122611 RepID=A0ABX8TUZ4_9ACTN|nr:hypothetical protein [Nonomuraea coxensis]QYC39295.1 hypothetical protein Nocox_08350 [Nonomuraea coxensis DSM 45129]
MRPYTGNRIGLAVVGATLAGAGGYAWLRGHGRFLDLPTNAKVLPAHTVRALTDTAWPLWALALVLLLLALAALRWLLLCLGWGRRGARNGTGTAMLYVGLKNVDGLSKARVRLGPDGLRLTLTCPSDADVGAVAGKLDQDVIGRIRRELRDDETPAMARLHVRR